jgi:aspartate-semialdehyde dehydrogenase
MPNSIAIVGGESLLGREIRELFTQSGLLVRVKLVGADPESEGLLTEVGDEAAVITPLDEENLSGSAVVILAGSPASSRKAFEIAQRATPPPALVDVSRALEDLPRARLRAPLAEPPDVSYDPDTIHVIAHPAAIALAMFFAPIAHHHAIRRSVVHVFEPASERGQRGLDELHKQTVNVFSFQGLPKNVFDAQLSFNMLARYGSEAPVQLEQVELGIERHLASLLSRDATVPMPSLRLIQAPVFHGYSFSIWVEFEQNPGPAGLAESLALPHVEVRIGDEEVPTNVGVAGQSGVSVGAMSTDRNEPRAVWFWMVADNLRLAAQNAVAVASRILAGAPA